MKTGIFIITLSLSFLQSILAQNDLQYKTWNPATDSIYCLEGQAWPGTEQSYYYRLPAKAESTVRKEVWNLARQSAGLSLRFRTNATQLTIRYMVTGSIQMPHMPAIGVSGVDLYSKTIDGLWTWCAGRISFGDTVVYRFTNLPSKDQHVDNREYTLYLPLYNSIKWMVIEMPEESTLKPIPPRIEKPIVVYGTSIAQGGCASRPGLAWTNILERKLSAPVINLGFSGNGRLEKEVLDLITEIDAQVYILDCLPNLMPQGISAAALKQRLTAAVLQLRKARPTTPILLTEHDGYTDGEMNAPSLKDYTEVNQVLKEVIDSLVASGVKILYKLTKTEINQDIESMVDGVHPNDIGMMRYADAYEKKLMLILQHTNGNTTTTKAITQRRDARIYDWESRHQEILDFNKTHSPEIALVGNSITHFWGGNPSNPINNGKEAWNKYFGNKPVVNMGFGWDRVENVLWRVQHGTLDGIDLKHIVLMIGTNNLGLNTDEEIVHGLHHLLQAIQSRQPAAGILLMGLLPRRKMEERIFTINQKIAKLANGKRIKYADAGALFLQKDNKINEGLFTDGLHPNESGYDQLGAFITKLLRIAE